MILNMLKHTCIHTYTDDLKSRQQKTSSAYKVLGFRWFSFMGSLVIGWLVNKKALIVVKLKPSWNITYSGSGFWGRGSS